MGKFSINDIKREVKLPKEVNKNLAEFFGVLTGDGYMNLYRKYDYIIEIAGNKISDKNYLLKYINKLIKKLFNINARYLEKKKENSAYLRIRSKAIFNYLLKKGFKRGKKENINIPDWIKRDENFMRFFIKGIFDTDGCLCIKNKEEKKYPVISITLKNENILLDIKNFLKDFELNSCITKQTDKTKLYKKEVIRYKLDINGYKNIDKWFKNIGSSNERNTSKYNKAKSYLK